MPIKRRIRHDPEEEIKKAKIRRDVGMARVEANADKEWNELAWETLKEYLRNHPTFFCDDLWLETNLPRPRESRALGPVILRAVRAGLIERSDKYRPSTASNMTPKPVWKSLIWKGERDRA